MSFSIACEVSENQLIDARLNEASGDQARAMPEHREDIIAAKEAAMKLATAMGAGPVSVYMHGQRTFDGTVTIQVQVSARRGG